MRLAREVVDDLEFMGDAYFERVAGGHCEQTVVPAAAVSEAFPVLCEGEPRDDPRRDVLRLDDFRLRRLQNVHRSAPEVAFLQPLDPSKFVGFAIPSWRDDFDAAVQPFADEVRKVDFVRRCEVDRHRAAPDRGGRCGHAPVAVQLVADDFRRLQAFFRRQRLSQRAHLPPERGFFLCCLFHASIVPPPASSRCNVRRIGRPDGASL